MDGVGATLMLQNPDTALWRDILITRYDDPREAAAYPFARESIDWKTLVKERTFVERVMEKTEDIDELVRVGARRRS